MSPRPALILIPGLLCDATVWKEQIEAFASTHEVIVPMLDGLDSIPDMAAAVLERAPPSSRSRDIRSEEESRSRRFVRRRRA